MGQFHWELHPQIAECKCDLVLPPCLDMCRCDLYQSMISGYYIYKFVVVDSLGGFLSGCLIANKQYITTVSSACLEPG